MSPAESILNNKFVKHIGAKKEWEYHLYKSGKFFPDFRNYLKLKNLIDNI
jgi:hypothetical protein